MAAEAKQFKVESVMVKVSPFGPSFGGRSVRSNDPEGVWTMSVVQVTRETRGKVVTTFEAAGEKTGGKGSGARLDTLVRPTLEGARKQMIRMCEIVGGWMSGGEVRFKFCDECFCGFAEAKAGDVVEWQEATANEYLLR
jgi:hypothetical protein